MLLIGACDQQATPIDDDTAGAHEGDGGRPDAGKPSAPPPDAGAPAEALTSPPKDAGSASEASEETASDASSAAVDAGSVAPSDAGAPVVDAGVARSGPVQGLLRLLDFETGGIQKGSQAHDGALTTYANCNGKAGIVEKPAFAYGKQAMRASVPATALPSGGCFQGSTLANVGIEVLGSRNQAPDLRANEEYWIGFALYLPPDTTAPKDDAWRILMLHDLPGHSVYSSIWIGLNTDLTFRVGHDGNVLSGHQSKRFGKPTLGSWQEFVIRFVPAFEDSKGKLQLWYRVRGEAFSEVDSYSGRTVASADEFPNFVNLSLFHNATKAGDSMSTRTVWYDEIRIGDHRVQFNDVVPGVQTTPP